MPGLRLPPETIAWVDAAAALVNSAPRATDPPEKLRDPADLDAILAMCPGEAPGGRDLEAMRALRGPLRALFEAPDVGAFAAAANPLLGGAGRQLVRGPGGWRLEAGESASLAAWFGARAAGALAELVLGYGVDRLHVCAADDCLRAVADVSRNGARRFCSRTCASRTNVRRHRQAHA